MLAPEEFDRLTAQASFAAAVQAGFGDLHAGGVDLAGRLDARFGPPANPTKKK